MLRTELFTGGARVAVEKGKVEMVCSKLLCTCRSRAGGQPWVTGVVSPARLWVGLKGWTRAVTTPWLHS